MIGICIDKAKILDIADLKTHYYTTPSQISDGKVIETKKGTGLIKNPALFLIVTLFLANVFIELSSRNPEGF